MKYQFVHMKIVVRLPEKHERLNQKVIKLSFEKEFDFEKLINECV